MALAFITKVYFLHIAGYPLDNTMNQFAERTTGTSLTESVLLLCDPDNPKQTQAMNR